MSAFWSITYLEAPVSERDLFDLIVSVFRSHLHDRLYTLESRGDQIVPVKLDDQLYVEWFDDPKRARMIADSCLVERFSQGVLIYPASGGLHILVDSVIQLNHLADSGRTRRDELLERLKLNPDPDSETLFHFTDYLQHITRTLTAPAAHIMFERNPAGRITGVNLYDSGQLFDHYYVENIEAIGEYGLVELPQNPAHVRRLMNGRFGFLLDQPRAREFDDEISEVYFDGEDLWMYDKFPGWDVFNIRAANLAVPFWDDAPLPLGAVYCLKDDLPDYFLKRYE